MKKRWLLGIGGLASAIAGLGIYSTNRLLHMEKKNDEEILQREINYHMVNMEEYEALPKENVTVPSGHGYTIHSVFVKPHNTKKFVIFAHGITVNKMTSIKYMNLFIKRGYNAVIYDHRRHGESGGATSTFGHFEKEDLKTVIKTLREREGEEMTYGLHGESMGAVTSLLYGGIAEDPPQFIVADCPFSDFEEQILYRFNVEMKSNGKWLLPITNLFLKIRGGFTTKDVSPLKVVENIPCPVLFIHSKDDTFILPAMTQSLFEKKKGAKKLYIAPYGEHAESYLRNQDEYERVLNEFLVEHSLVDKL
ncbi:hypothetical protein Q75_09075 [Bacillus coahuilensis p1.1.43]|uniref:Serine aminopeptidase S33 domain-containing protein n=1 Tax=Bacillus coahuilensis p1.1.43 TaxID=1150625 RepID=A0A147K7Y1_9BACI|nr:alpha/beta hydrolase [Bacillus coahuilensis]KUP06281.1 hypothetical protein Q75_09075 [Bacillus coahuilensis p1.1.43]